MIRVKKTYFAISIALVILICVLLFVEGGKKKRVRQARALVTIDTTEPTTHNYDVLKNYIGTLYPAHTFDVHSKVGGRIVEMNYDIGDRVENGAVIALIDDTQYQLSYRQAEGKLNMEESKVRQKQMAIDLAQREFERMKALRAEKVISESQLEKAQYDFERQKLTFEVDQASLGNQKTAVELSELQLSYTQIEARWSTDEVGGTRLLAERFVDEGVIINQNKPIATIIDVGLLKAEIFVGEAEYPYFKAGMKVTIEVDAYEGDKFEGEVARVAPFLNEQTRQAKVQITVQNPDLRLRPGMFARTSVVFQTRNGVNMLPKSCIVESRNNEGVYLYDEEEKKVYFRPVEIGDVRDGMAEILNVRQLNMPVVSIGQQMVRHGLLVNHVKDREPTAADARRLAAQKRAAEAAEKRAANAAKREAAKKQGGGKANAKKAAPGKANPDKEKPGNAESEQPAPKVAATQAGEADPKGN